MCGIVAYAGKSPETFNKDKFNILGIWNETRGGDSCGVSIDGELYKGIGNFKVYRDFITYKYIPFPSYHPTVIAHTRKASSGASHTTDNAHPFGFCSETNPDVNEFVGVHNGTLHNDYELANQYGIERTVDTVRLNTQGVKIDSFRTKIDSEILLEILHRTDDYTVLEEYTGGAALVWYDTNEPNVMYCYHGKSRKFSSYGEDHEDNKERPLFYYKESKNSLYVSSIEDSLISICDSDLNDIGEFDYNVVYKITDGDIDNAVKTEIDRSKACQTDYGYGRYSTYGGGSTGFRGSTKRSKRNRNKNKSKLESAANRPSVVLPNIHTESPTKNNINDYKGKVYFNQLRYWRNNHLINGIFLYVKGYGFVELGDNFKAAKEAFWLYVGKPFNTQTGKFVLNNEDKSTLYVPYPNPETILSEPFHYMFNGIDLKTQLDYDTLNNHLENDKLFSPESLSLASKHPIVGLSQMSAVNAQNILYDGKLYSGKVTVLGSDKIYTIKEGNLKSFREVNEHFKLMTNKDIVNTRSMQQELLKIINEDSKTENADDKKSETSELLLDDLGKMFTTMYTTLPDYVTQIEKYPDCDTKTKVLDCMASIKAELDGVIDLTKK